MLYYHDPAYLDFFRRAAKFAPITPPLSSTCNRISLCIVCMNRTDDLKATLGSNLENTRSYPNLEFVVLDYHSTECFDDWLQQTFPDELRGGRLRYYRTEQPTHYLPCHSKNAAAKLATGDIVVNLDADNYLPNGYLQIVNACLVQQRTVTVSDAFLRTPDRIMLRGRVGTWKCDFLALGGYDEDLDDGWGSDDLNFTLRCLLAGYSLAPFPHHFVENRIDTPNDKRVACMANHNFEVLKKRNVNLCGIKLARREIVVNQGRSWGEVELVR
jgi:glycosyltransferase involved in cell wall biosynthesis